MSHSRYKKSLIWYNPDITDNTMINALRLSNIYYYDDKREI